MSENTSAATSETDVQADRSGSLTLALRREALATATSWVTLAPEERRRRAAQAARDRDLPTLQDLTEASMTLHSSAGATLSPHTRRAYRIGVARAVSALEGESLLAPRGDWGSLYRAALSAEGSPATCAVRLAAARALYAALRWSGATEADPLKDVGGVRDSTPAWEKRAEYTDADLERLLAVANPRERLIVLLGAHAGLRVADMADLQTGDLDLANRSLRVRRGKGGKARTVTLSDTLLEALRGYAPRHDSSSLLGVGAARLWQIMRSLCARTGGEVGPVRSLGVHSLRHSSGTRLYRETGDLLLVRDHLGHASVVTSERYAKGDERLRAAVGNW